MIRFIIFFLNTYAYDTKLTFFFFCPQVTARKIHYLAILKLIPQWLALFLLKSGIADFFCSSIFHLSGMNATEMNNKLTSNKDLHVIFSYFFYGETFCT